MSFDFGLTDNQLVQIQNRKSKLQNPFAVHPEETCPYIDLTNG